MHEWTCLLFFCLSQMKLQKLFTALLLSSPCHHLHVTLLDWRCTGTMPKDVQQARANPFCLLFPQPFLSGLHLTEGTMWKEKEVPVQLLERHPYSRCEVLRRRERCQARSMGWSAWIFHSNDNKFEFRRCGEQHGPQRKVRKKADSFSGLFPSY